MADFVCLAAFTILQVAILLAVAHNLLLVAAELRDVLVEVFDLVDLFSLEFALFLRYFLHPYLVNELYLVFTRLAPALSVAKEAVLEALAIAVKATFAIVTSRFAVLTLSPRHILIEELLEQLLSQLLVLPRSSAFLYVFIVSVIIVIIATSVCVRLVIL